jgi:hypothetical protein
MFEITFGWLAPLLIAIAAVARPYVLNYLKQNGVIGNILYFLVLILLIVPLNMYQPRFTLVSLNDESAKELVAELLKNKILQEYKNPKNIHWQPYNEQKKLYNIQAEVEKEGKSFKLYIQPKCQFFKGCEVGLDKIVILAKDSKDNRDMKSIDEDMFLHRSCSDRVAFKILQGQTAPGIFKMLFNGFKKIQNTIVDYKIIDLSIEGAKKFDTKEKIKYKEKEFTLGSECMADMDVTGEFMIRSKDKDVTAAVFSYIFDSVKKDANDRYLLATPIYYNIYYNQKSGNIKVIGTFIDKNKTKKK